jgi:hypothetical protein
MLAGMFAASRQGHFAPANTGSLTQGATVHEPASIGAYAAARRKLRPSRRSAERPVRRASTIHQPVPFQVPNGGSVSVHHDHPESLTVMMSTGVARGQPGIGPVRTICWR